MLFIRLFLANAWEKKSGVTVLVFSQTAVKGGHGFEIAVRIDNSAAETGTRCKIKPIVFEVCTRNQSFFSVVCSNLKEYIKYQEMT